MQTNLTPSNNLNPETESTRKYGYSIRRVRIGLSITLVGFIVFMIGVKPALIGMDRSPVVGFVQISVFLVGLGIISVGGYLSMLALWRQRHASIAADFGQRFVATGYMISFASGMADIIGLGSHPLPRPFFGPLQALGVELGAVMICLGFLLMVPYHLLFHPRH